MLVEFATVGCDAAIPSAQLPEPATQLRQETLKIIKQGYARLVAWDSIKDNPPPNLKISPIAAIPHKSCGYWMILDLSYSVTIDNTRHPSVNEVTKPNVAPSHAMTQLGQILPRLIYAVATAPENKGPLLFSKLDIKDGYWRMVVSPVDEWNFAYVLPKLTPDEPTQLVIPTCLQMGWRESASYFCAALETA